MKKPAKTAITSPAATLFVVENILAKLVEQGAYMFGNYLIYKT